MIPHSRPFFDISDAAALLEVLASGDVSSGHYIGSVERWFELHTGHKHALTFNSWTTAAQTLFQQIAAVHPGAEVILPSFTFAATANVVAAAGLTPIFADLPSNGFNITLESIQPHLTSSTAAIMVVHYAGIMSDLQGLVDFCESHGILLIEDCAESLGSSFEGRVAGSYGIGIYSFFASKNITCGEGGVIAMDSEESFRELQLVRGHGIPGTATRDFPWAREAILVGSNYRMSNLNASLAMAQLQKLERLNAERQRRASLYMELLAGIPQVQPPFIPEGSSPSWQMFPITVPSAERNDLVTFLNARGIGASVHFSPPVHQQKAFTQRAPNTLALSHTERIASKVVTLPMYVQLDPSSVVQIVDTIKQFFLKP